MTCKKRYAQKDKLATRRERDRARRQAKRTAEVWAMPADEVPAEEKGKYNTFFEVVDGYRKNSSAADAIGNGWIRWRGR